MNITSKIALVALQIAHAKKKHYTCIENTQNKLQKPSISMVITV
jgi:hypothetical protein